MGATKVRSLCLYPGCLRMGRSIKPSYCTAHYQRRLRAIKQAAQDAAADRAGKVPTWVRRARYSIMASLMRRFGAEIDEFKRRGHL